jgi:putative transposase
MRQPNDTIKFEYSQRHSPRLKTYDYSSSGAYFITLCTLNRECMFGGIIDDRMLLNANGEIVLKEWLKTPEIRREIKLDEYVVMPNHFHAVVFIDGRGDRPVARPDNQDVVSPGQSRLKPASIGAFVGGFKSSVTVRINEIRQTPNLPVWQRNYYEHVIRNEDELNEIRQYISTNPLKWALDRENPELKR